MPRFWFAPQGKDALAANDKDRPAAFKTAGSALLVQ